MNPRYALYAKAHGKTPEEMLQADRKAWPGGVMTGFILWNRERIVEASNAIPNAFFMGNIHDHAAYDKWLDEWVDRKLESAS